MIRFTEKISGKKLGLFLLPLMLSAVFQQIYEPVSAAVAGRYLNEEAVAVIGACSGWSGVVESLFVHMTTGFSICINRQAGLKDSGKMRSVFQTAVKITLFLTFGSMLLALFTEPFMGLANIPEWMQPEARRYLVWLFLGGGFWGIQNLLACVIQGKGESTFPSIVMIASAVAQTAMSVVLLGMLGVGVEGVSLAVFISQGISSLLLFLYLCFRDWGRELICPLAGGTPGIWRDILESGTAKSMMGIMTNIGYMAVQRCVNLYSVDVIAGYTYAMSLMNLFMQPLCAYAIAANIMSAQNVGSGSPEMAFYYNRKMTVHSLYWCAGYVLLAPVWVPSLMRLLAGPGVSPGLLQAGNSWLYVAVASYPFLVVLMIGRNALQGMGYYKVLLLLGFLEMAARFFSAWVLVPLMGYTAVCLNTALVWGLPGLTALWLYRKRMKEAWRDAYGEERVFGR